MKKITRAAFYCVSSFLVGLHGNVYADNKSQSEKTPHHVQSKIAPSSVANNFVANEAASKVAITINQNLNAHSKVQQNLSFHPITSASKNKLSHDKNATDNKLSPPLNNSGAALKREINIKDWQHQHIQHQLNLSNSMSKNQTKTDNKIESENSSKNTLLATCDTSGYGSKNGQPLVDHILTQDQSCINDLYNGTSTSFAAFQPQNMRFVADATKDIAVNYSLANGPNNINNLYYFLRTGYYIEYYFPDEVGPYQNDVQSAIRGALDALVNNVDFYANSNQHGKNITDAIILVDSAGENARYLFMVKNWLSRWDNSYASSWNMRAAVNGIFTVLFRGHYQTDFKTATSNDHQLIQQLGNFVRSDWMLSSDALYLQENAAGELARFLQYDNAPIYTTVKNEVQASLDRYDMNGTGNSVWIRLATVIDSLGKCSDFGICGFKEQLEAQVLSQEHTCSNTLKMRVEDMTNSQFSDSCLTLSEQEIYFHQMLTTNNTPVSNDNNSALEMVIFDSSDSYKTHAGLFFGINTNNGGMYLEGDPGAVNNQARFIAHEAEWLLPDFYIWNLTHEYVHYLDGRFNLYGDFGDARTNTHKTVWWIEGLAEYISQKNFNDAAIALARTKAYSLSNIFSNDYNSGQDRVYRWGYLAVRFMFENHSDDVNQILNHFRAGDYDAYLNYINGLSTNYNNEWYDWLEVVDSTDGGTNPPTPGETELVNGQTVTQISSPTDLSDRAFYIDLPANASDLKVEISGGTGDADLYLKSGSMPTDTDYDCRPYKSGNIEICEDVAPQAGRWYVRIKAYNSYQNLSLTASYADNQNEPDVIELINGQAINNLSAPEPNDELNFYIDIPANTSNLNFNISGGSGDADMYVKFAEAPTDNNYDCRPYAGGNNEVCDFATPQPGRWFVKIKAYASFANLTLSASFASNENGFDGCSTNPPISSGNLENNTPVCVAQSNGISYFYTYVAPGTESLLVELNGGTGNGDLYGSFSSWATTSNYQFLSVSPNNNESMLMSNPPQGWVYFSVVANPAYGNTNLRVLHQ